MKVMIGLETHVRLGTRTKLFCGCAVGKGEACPICMGFPGTKPSPCKAAVEKALRIALALKCSIGKRMSFSRKAYFYPDLPKSYQITQYEEPLATSGLFEIRGKRVRIRRVHIEEDPAKIEHGGGSMLAAGSTLVDHSRSGAPLCEIVTEPDLSTPEEAREYSKALFGLLCFIGAVEREGEGAVRTDANISIEGGARVEIKGITGFAAIERAVRGEIHRQAGLGSLGKRIAQETRLFDPKTGTTFMIRKKEGEEDYGYIFEPDIPPITISGELLREAREAMPELPEEAKARLVSHYGIKEREAGIIARRQGLVEFFEKTCEEVGDAELVAKWCVGDYLKCVRYAGVEIGERMPAGQFAELLKGVRSGEATVHAAKEEMMALFSGESLRTGRLGTEEAVSAVIGEESKAVSDFKAGKAGALEFLVGRVLRGSRSVDPKEARRFLLQKLA